MAACSICTLPINLDDPTLWREITGWVHGPKRDSLSLRQDTGNVAHNECIATVKAGQDPSTADIFAELPVEEVPHDKPGNFDDLFG